MTIKEGGFFSSTPYGGENEGGNFYLSKPHGYNKFGIYIQGSEAPEWTQNIHCAIGTSNRLELIKQYQDNGNAFADMNSSGVCFGHAVVCAESDANSDIAESLERCESVYTTTQQREPWQPGLNSPRGCFLDANDRPILPAWQNAQGGYHPVSRQGPHLMMSKQDGGFYFSPTQSGDGTPLFPGLGGSQPTGLNLSLRVTLPFGAEGPLEAGENFVGDLIRSVEGDPFGRQMGWWGAHCEFDTATVYYMTRNGCKIGVVLDNAGSYVAGKIVQRLNEAVTPPKPPRVQKKPPGSTGPNIPDTITYETIHLSDGTWYIVTTTTDSNGSTTTTNGPIIYPPDNGPIAFPGGMLGGGGYVHPSDHDWENNGGGVPDGGFGIPGAPSNGGGNQGGPGGPGTVNPEAPQWAPNPNGGGNNGFGGEFVPPGGDPNAPGGSGLVQTTHPRWPAPLHQDAPPYWYLQPKSINSKSLNAWFTDNNNKLTQRSKGSLPYALASWDSVYWPNPKNPDPTKIWDTHHIMTGQNVPLWAKLDLNLDITAESPTKNTLPIDNQTNIRFPNHWVSSNTETSSNAVSFPRNTNGLNLSIEQSRSLKTTPHKSFFVPSYVDVTSTVYKTIPTKSTWPLDILSYSKTLGTSISTANPSVSI